MGRPGTPGPSDGGGNSENKATFSGTVLLLAIISFVLGAVAIAVPHWGYFAPPGAGYSQFTQYSYENTGYFGPFLKCVRTAGGYGSHCGQRAGQYQIYVYMRIGGICAVVATASIAFFCLFAGLHCMMQVNNKKICISYKKNILFALITAIIADIATVGAVAISAPQFSSSQQSFVSQMGPCFYIEICLILFNLLLVVLSYVSYKKALKTNFPVSRGQAYVISGDQYGNENPAGPQHQRGITVTNQSGVHYTHQQQQNSNGHVATLNHTQLPPYPAPNNQQGFYPTNQGNGHVNNGYNQFGQVAQPQQPAPSGLLQQQRAHIQMRVNDSPMGVSSNPMGGRIRAGAGGGSIDTLSTNDGDNVSINSYGSTGSFNSTASINNPMRSSLKKPKNKETASVASAASKKSVRIALGEEQTAV